MRYGSSIHDSAVFVVYSNDAPSYFKWVISPAEQDALVAEVLEHWRRNGRDVVLHERSPEETPDG